MSEAIRVRITEVRQYLRNVKTRMPFRYGAATLTHVPILHLRTQVESSTGQQAEGWSADCLPPGWFDKRPGRTFREDIDSLRFVVDAAVDTYLASGEATPFELWRNAYQEVRKQGFARGENGLTCGFGSSLVERSVIDAVGKLAGTEFHRTVRENLLGIDLGSLHDELAGTEPADYLAPAPKTQLFARHTIGLVDPLTAAELPDNQRLNDGLPQTFEEYLTDRGIRYVKLKINNEPARDMERVRTVAALLEKHRPDGYVVSLDGNEQFTTAGEVLAMLESIEAEPGLERFFRSIEYVEQPLSRQVALDPSSVGDLRAVSAKVPVAIDESDDRIEAFRTAIDLGYRGISVKNCKGVTKAVANCSLAGFHNRWRPGYFLTGEDLMNTAAVPLQQDLATGALIGLSHIERNGHHYVQGLTHLSPEEVAGCLEHHDDLYEPYGGDNAQVRIRDGALTIESLRVPGYAVAFPPNWAALTPGDEWRYEDLGLPE